MSDTTLISEADKPFAQLAAGRDRFVTCDLVPRRVREYVEEKRLYR